MQSHVVASLQDMAARFWIVLFINILIFDLVFARKCCGAHFKWLREQGEDCKNENKV